MSTNEQTFLREIEANFGIIRKIVHLYVEYADQRRDLQQEILYQAWKAYPAFQGGAKFSTWLYRVSLNTALTFRKREYRRATAGLEVVGLDRPMPETPDSDNAERLYGAIRQLKAAERALVLLYLDGFGHDDIADITGMTVNNVGVKLHRIKNELTKRLNN